VHLVGNMLLERTGSAQGSLQFRYSASRNDLPNGDSLDVYIPTFYWNLYSDNQGFKINSVSNKDNETQRMIISKSNGSVGIGVATPQAKLHVNKHILSDGNVTATGNFVLSPDNSKTESWEISRTATGLNYAYKSSSQKNILFLGKDGNMGIGVSTPPLTNMQIGDIWTFQDASGKQNIGRNTYFNGTNDVRIQQGVASRITFNNSGEILLQTTSSGIANSTIRWNTVTFSNSGNVGIGTTTTPQAKLEVAGDIKAQSADIDGPLSAGAITASSANISTLTVTSADVTNLLTVPKARITELLCANEIKVQLFNCWPDYVFSKKYKLLSLKELEHFIAENQHLPNVPSAAEVEENGVNVGEMNAILLQKVEELTLYIIQLEKRLTEIENKKGD